MKANRERYTLGRAGVWMVQAQSKKCPKLGHKPTHHASTRPQRLHGVCYAVCILSGLPRVSFGSVCVGPPLLPLLLVLVPPPLLLRLPMLPPMDLLHPLHDSHYAAPDGPGPEVDSAGSTGSSETTLLFRLGASVQSTGAPWLPLLSVVGPGAAPGASKIVWM